MAWSVKYGDWLMGMAFSYGHNYPGKDVELLLLLWHKTAGASYFGGVDKKKDRTIDKRPFLPLLYFWLARFKQAAGGQ